MKLEESTTVIIQKHSDEQPVESIIRLPVNTYSELVKTSSSVKYKQWVMLRHDGWEFYGRPLPADISFIHVNCGFKKFCGGKEISLEFLDKVPTLESVTLSKQCKSVLANILVGPSFVGPDDCTVLWCEPRLIGLITITTTIIIDQKNEKHKTPDANARKGTLERASYELQTLMENGQRQLSICAASGSGKSWIVEQTAEIVKYKYTRIHSSDLSSFPINNEEQDKRVIYIVDADEQCPSREQFPGKLSNLALFCYRLNTILSNGPNTVIVLGFREIQTVDKYYMSEWLQNVIHIRFPDYDERLYILEHLQNSMVSYDLARVAQLTSGYMFADLCRLLVHLNSKTDDDHEELEKKVKSFSSSVMSRFKMDIDRSVSWESLGGLRLVRQQVQEILEDPFKYRKEFAKYGIRPPRGILMHGPPGCSKTSIAKAIANSMSLPFYTLDTAAIFSSFVGESERLIRELFQAARLTAPSIIFFDEVEVIVGRRDGKQRDALQERLLATFLTEMDGFDNQQDEYVLVIGATNRADNIDSALLRPGRFDHVIHVPLPDHDDRVDILLKLTDLSVDEIRLLADETEGKSTADLAGIVRSSQSPSIESYRESIHRHLHGRVQSLFTL